MGCTQDFKTGDRSPIEKPQLQFCKRYLEVNNKATGGGGGGGGGARIRPLI